MDRLSEIRTRCEAVKAEKDKGNLDDCASLAYAVTQVDIPYLLSLLEETWEWDMYQCAKREIDRLRGEVVRLTADRWIPVEERLPEVWRNDETSELVNYMIYSPDFGVDIGNYHAKAKRWLCMALPCTVTHWMPLPEPPKEARHV